MRGGLRRKRSDPLRSDHFRVAIVRFGAHSWSALRSARSLVSSCWALIALKVLVSASALFLFASWSWSFVRSNSDFSLAIWSCASASSLAAAFNGPGSGSAAQPAVRQIRATTADARMRNDITKPPGRGPSFLTGCQSKSGSLPVSLRGPRSTTLLHGGGGTAAEGPKGHFFVWIFGNARGIRANPVAGLDVDDPLPTVHRSCESSVASESIQAIRHRELPGLSPTVPGYLKR
jgi:hypothetical protein